MASHEGETRNLREVGSVSVIELAGEWGSDPSYGNSTSAIQR